MPTWAGPQHFPYRFNHKDSNAPLVLAAYHFALGNKRAAN